MIVDLETLVSRSLRAAIGAVASGSPIPESDARLEFESTLERYVPALLGWQHEAFDAFRLCVAEKRGATDAEFLGLALLISDQTWTPFWLRISISSAADTLTHLHCKVGERGEGPAGMVRTPYQSTRASKLLDSLPRRASELQWAYDVEISNDLTIR
jgi:hypothetical protein